jgi:hypothetical protein
MTRHNTARLAVANIHLRARLQTFASQPELSATQLMFLSRYISNLSLNKLKTGPSAYLPSQSHADDQAQFHFLARYTPLMRSDQTGHVRRITDKWRFLVFPRRPSMLRPIAQQQSEHHVTFSSLRYSLLMS